MVKFCFVESLNCYVYFIIFGYKNIIDKNYVWIFDFCKIFNVCGFFIVFNCYFIFEKYSSKLNKYFS